MINKAIMSAASDVEVKIQVTRLLNKCNRNPWFVKLALILVIEILFTLLLAH